MKKLLLLMMTLVTISTQAQEKDYSYHFQCYKASVSRFNLSTEKWDKQFVEDNANYNITLSNDVLTINANNTQVYKLFHKIKEPYVNKNGNFQIEYKAYNVTQNDRICDVTLILMKDNKFVNVHIFYFDADPYMNLAYSAYRQ